MDKIIRANSTDGKIRAFGITHKNLTEKAREIHGTSPVVTAGFGRLMGACLMMAQTLKGEDETLSLQIKGDGPVGTIVTVSDLSGAVRGYVGNANVDIPLKSNGKLDVGGSVGKGYLTVVRDLKMKEPYVGRTALVSGEIAEDLTYYFASSEQTPSIVALGVLVDRDYTVRQAGGYIVQLMPDATDEDIAVLENNINGIKSVTQLFEDGNSIEDILKMVCKGFTLDFTDELTPEYRCNCNRDRIERVLISIGKSEIEDIIKNEGKTSLNCYFCNTDYEFSKEDLEKLLSDINF